MQTKLLILGALHGGNFHPYEIKRRLENALAECYVDIDVGILSHTIRRLEKDELIAAIAAERVTRGGMRTIYQITPQGKAEFRKLLHGQFEDEGPVSQTLYGALLFLHLSDLERVEGLLCRRLARLDELIAYLRPASKDLPAEFSIGAGYLLDHLDKERRLDRDWLMSLLADVRARRVQGMRELEVPPPAL